MPTVVSSPFGENHGRDGVLAYDVLQTKIIIGPDAGLDVSDKWSMRDNGTRKADIKAVSTPNERRAKDSVPE